MTPEQQHRLAIELAAWNADEVRRRGDFTETAGGRLLDSATSPFAGTCFTLWALGAATVTDADGNPPPGQHGAPPPHFRLPDDSDVRTAVAGREVMPREFSALIRDFVGTKKHAPEAFEMSGAWFRPSLPQPLLDAFVAAGFLESSNDRCRWTDDMAQWVEWSGAPHWETPAESEERHLRTYGPIWKSMPRRYKERIVEGGKINTLLLPDAIRRFWDGRWHDEQLPAWEDQKRLIDAMEIARQIERLVAARRLSLYSLYPLYNFLRRFERRSDR